jgi:GST-like protein
MDGEHVLYGSVGSGSAAIEAALEIAGQRYRVVSAATWDETSALDELRRVNPLQQIPALVFPDGAVMTESAAILIELGLRHPASGLLPHEPVRRARVLRGLVYVAANCYAAIGTIDYPERWLPGAGPAALERLRAGATERLHLLWEGFADITEPSSFLGGEQPGALDLLACVVSRWSGARAHLRAHRPACSLLLERIEQHPVVARVCERHWPE